MALKLKKLPKKPKATASAKVKEAWLKKAAAIRKENAAKVRENKRSEALSKKIAAINNYVK